MAIPATLHEALQARLDRLGSAKGVAQLGATLGSQLAYALLRAVAPLEDGPLQRDLATLIAAELLYHRGQPPRAVYTFKHALVQDAAYESVLQRVRRDTHQRIVQMLEAQLPGSANSPSGPMQVWVWRHQKRPSFERGTVGSGSERTNCPFQRRAGQRFGTLVLKRSRIMRHLLRLSGWRVLRQRARAGLYKRCDSAAWRSAKRRRRQTAPPLLK